MTVSQKAAFSLLISILLFAGFTVLAYMGLFDLVEARFYNPSVTKAINGEINQDTEVIDTFLAETLGTFYTTLQEPAIQRSFLPNQSAEDIFERSRIFGILLESQSALQSVRFIDAGGSRIHYSTDGADILRQDRLSVAYRNFPDTPSYIPYDTVAVPSQGSPKILLDSVHERLVFSLPFYDSFEVYRGTALFTLSIQAVADTMIRQGRINIGEDITVLSDPAGLVSRLPRITRRAMVPLIASIWNSGDLELTALDQSESGLAFALASSKTSQNIFVGRIVEESLFEFPDAMKYILLGLCFFTLYLIIFLSFNLQQDPMTIVQGRFSRLQTSLLEEYRSRKDEMDWERWTWELEQRREEVRAEVKRGIRAKKGKQSDTEIDAYIDTSWNEFTALIRSQYQKAAASAAIDEAKIREIVSRLIGDTHPGSNAVVPAPKPAAALTTPVVKTNTEKSEDVDEVEELEDAEVVEELDEVEELEDAEVVEELDEVEELEDAEVVEELDEVEELEDAEPVEELDEVEELEDAEPVEELDEVEELEESASAENNNENEKIDEVKPLEKTDKPNEDDELLEEFEELEELEELDEVEELEEAVEAPDEPQNAPLDRKNAMDQLISQIEFSSVSDENEEEEADLPELEIVSPFASLLSNFDEESTETVEEQETDDDGNDDDGNDDDSNNDDEKKNGV
ncbi:hypothetical protein FACS1894151_06540 [Spirochaetia bacterium]|nr:hypothetical protein FACS1894151_06540 [Spirochaetia bacterium]